MCFRHLHQPRFAGSNERLFPFPPVCVWQRRLLCVYGCYKAKQLSQSKQGLRMADCSSGAVKYSHLEFIYLCLCVDLCSDASFPHLSSKTVCVLSEAGLQTARKAHDIHVKEQKVGNRLFGMLSQ